MFPDKIFVGVIHAERVAQAAEEYRIRRLLERPPRRPVRQAIGRSMVRIGARLASDPNLDLGPARSR